VGVSTSCCIQEEDRRFWLRNVREIRPTFNCVTRVLLLLLLCNPTVAQLREKIKGTKWMRVYAADGDFYYHKPEARLACPHNLLFLQAALPLIPPEIFSILRSSGRVPHTCSSFCG